LLHELSAQDAKFVTAETIYGKIRGVDNNGIKTFKGIPYGASTSGANRFMAPAEPAKCWRGGGAFWARSTLAR
jgi:para-nitrobenzyl esterase